MPDDQNRLVFEQLSSRLGELTEALFDRAPYCRGRFQGAGRGLTALCRGPSSAAMALQQFESQWPLLSRERQRNLTDDWELGIIRLLRQVKEPCSSCDSAFGNGAFKELLECSNCGLKVATLSQEIDRFGKNFDASLGLDQQPPKVPQENGVAEVIQAQDATIQKLERECSAYKETLDEVQKALENASDEKIAQQAQIEVLGKARDGLQQAYSSLDGELRECIDNVERYAEDLDIGMRWQTAQSAYAALHRYTLARRDRLEATPANDESRRDMELKSLGFKNKQVVALVKLGRHVDAEPMAKYVWDRRKELLPANSKDIRSISKDYCDILRRNGKCAEAEREYVYMWYEAMHGLSDTDEEEWKLETASRIGDVMAEQDRFGEAAQWHRRVLEQRLGRTPVDVDRAATAAVQCLAAQRLSGYMMPDPTIITDLDRIWRERVPNSESENVLSCGHELGTRLQGLGRDEEAAPILLTVWEKRKARGDGLLADAMSTALSLVDLSVKTENISRLETLYHWILMNPIADQGEGERLWYRYRLACVQAILEKWAIAEDNLRRALASQRQLFGADDPDTLQFTQVLAEVLRRERRLGDATNLVRNIWDARHRHPRNALQTILRVGHLYGDMIMESDSPEDLMRAEAILREVWESTSRNMSTMMPLVSLVPSGDCYGMCLMKLRRFAEAQPILAQVVEWKKWLSLDQAEVDASSHLLTKAVAWASRDRPPKYRPAVVNHQLRLRDLLDRWFSATVVAQAIADH